MGELNLGEREKRGSCKGSKSLGPNVDVDLRPAPIFDHQPNKEMRICQQVNELAP